jgi:hypothetical protein
MTVPELELELVADEAAAALPEVEGVGEDDFAALVPPPLQAVIKKITVPVAAKTRIEGTGRS